MSNQMRDRQEAQCDLPHTRAYITHGANLNCIKMLLIELETQIHKLFIKLFEKKTVKGF